MSVVVFDLGNVLIPWDRRRLFEQVIDDADELDYFLEHVYTLDENAALDRGVALARVTADLTRRYPQYQHAFHAFEHRWIETLGPVIEGSVELLAELIASQHRCFALSNWGRDTFSLIRHRYPFFDWFEGMVISGFEGVVKPEPAIFELMCGRHGIVPHDTVFIDDSLANVEVAARLGFDAIVFTGAATLRADLMSRGLVAA